MRLLLCPVILMRGGIQSSESLVMKCTLRGMQEMDQDIFCKTSAALQEEGHYTMLRWQSDL